MRKATLLLMCLLAAIGFAAPTAAERAPKLLLIGVDGARIDALRAADTPMLDALAAEGALIAPVRIQGARYSASDTISGPGWSSILTGVWADKHGVDDNRFADPRFDAYPHFFRRIKSSNPDALTISLVSWAPIDEFIVANADIREALELDAAVGDDDPAALLAAERRRDERMAGRAASLLASEDPTAMFVYFHQVDAAGHAIGYGPEIPEYISAIGTVDSLIGRLLAALRARPSYAREDWLVLVTTDHGGAGRGHGAGHGDPNVASSFIISSEPAHAAARNAAIVDIVPTALDHLGIPINAAWGLDGRPFSGL